MTTDRPAQHIVIRQADWILDRSALQTVREEVFIREQRVPEALEWDAYDARALHLLALGGDRPVATARLTTDGRIGRMAVLAPWRHRGIGAALLDRLLEVARAQGLTRPRLNAQTTALGFYRRAGFRVVGEEFLDAGIPHYRMELSLPAATDQP